MPSPSTLTIVFRGLLVFHEDQRNNRMEIGLLPAEQHNHIPRIMTIKNGVLFSTKPLTDEIPGRDRKWLFKPDRPVGDGPYLRKSGREPMRRLTHGVESDFRWIIDIESREFPYGDLTEAIDTTRLKPLMYIPNGEFYTRLRSTKLRRLQDGADPKPFGCVAGAIGCDITLEGNVVDLIDTGTGDTIFQFMVEPNTIYEFSNTPPDTEAYKRPEGDKGTGGHLSHVEAGHDDHFLNYYDLFQHPGGVPKFSFEEEPLFGGPPGPNPALCGEVYLGERETPLD
jgi:hypothetical protein